ncbi:MAG TPA: tRNA-dihydrouridine synthase [bacterium]|nr:tRNA-dihydrouridine synthase [bacterium]
MTHGAPFSGFWGGLKKPIVALSPMDGVTDFACRAMNARYGRPDVMFTEFTTTVGIFYAPEKVLRDFDYSEIERPIVAQVYGNHPDDFYRAAHVVAELGFDGLDINMGCPAKQVTQKNCGAALIRVPELALGIVRATRLGLEDWARGQTLESLKIPERVISVVAGMNVRRAGYERPSERRLIPYSVKTRLGFDEVVIEDWVKTLLSERPAVISVHGRTLKQMYKGAARWEDIARAAAVARGTGTLLLGNGDLPSLAEAHRRIAETGVDGVLIGRASLGNPWVFRKDRAEGESEISKEERIRVALEHARYFVEVRGEREFKAVRKHMVGYLRSFPDAASLRRQALDTPDLKSLSEVLHAAL